MSEVRGNPAEHSLAVIGDRQDLHDRKCEPERERRPGVAPVASPRREELRVQTPELVVKVGVPAGIRMRGPLQRCNLPPMLFPLKA